MEMMNSIKIDANSTEILILYIWFRRDPNFSLLLEMTSLSCCHTSVLQRTLEANPASENGLFIFTACIKSVPLYHFKLADVVLHMAVKKFFETHF